MKRILAVALTLAMLLGLSGCSGLTQMIYGRGSRLALTTQRMVSLLTGVDMGNIIPEPDPAPRSGKVDGDLDKLYSTEWFDFRVDEMYVTDVYKAVEADEGYVFIVATVYELNDWGGNADLPMSSYDFRALVDDDSREIEPEDAWDAAMMPDFFYLAPQEEVVYDVVFQVPEDSRRMQLIYDEVAENDDVYDRFALEFTL